VKFSGKNDVSGGVDSQNWGTKHPKKGGFFPKKCHPKPEGPCMAFLKTKDFVTDFAQWTI
jgi:hypothetical protein